jgi:hypothetical protein
MPREIDAGPVAAAVGALLLLVSLFLDWFEPGVSAWTVFEVLDLVLAALALAALVALLDRLGLGLPGGSDAMAVGAGAVVALGGVALLVVISQLLNHPPAAFGRELESGAFLGLAGAALMLGGGILSVGRVSFAVSVDERARAQGAAAPAEERGGRAEAEEIPGSGRGASTGGPPVDEPVEPSPSAEARAAEPEVQDELYPEGERRGPIGADDPETGAPLPADEDETRRLPAEEREPYDAERERRDRR